MPAAARDGGGDGEGRRVSAAAGCGRGGKAAGASRPAPERSQVMAAAVRGGESGGGSYRSQGWRAAQGEAGAAGPRMRVMGLR